MDVTHLRRISSRWGRERPVAPRRAARFLALLALAGGAALAGPIGCGLFMPPPLPQMPELPAPPEPPKPPDVQPPKPPELQSPVDVQEAGNCCFRNTKAVDNCNGANRCCDAKLELDECESKGGFWFHTPEDCAGAC